MFYDPVLSGNRNIACASCHHHDLASGDGSSLSVGEGGAGVGPGRDAGAGRARIERRTPRNAPALFNLGAFEHEILFHDGRLSISERYQNGFDSPAEEWLPKGLAQPLAAQALFPLTSEVEMAGSVEENEIAGAAQDRIDAAWPIIAKRVRTIPDYGAMLVEAFDHLERPEDATIVEIANAIGAFVAAEWRSFDSPYDAWLRGEEELEPEAARGAALFFGEAGCATCHSGKLLTDHGFHALGLPQFGPGRTRRFDPIPRDRGRIAESDILEDAYRFRTPSLRNVALTAPYGHNGAYPTLEGIVRHHLDPMAARASWDPSGLVLPAAPWLDRADFVIREDVRERERLERAIEIRPVALDDAEIADLIAFLHALTGRESVRGRLGPPERVPSGLAVERAAPEHRVIDRGAP